MPLTPEKIKALDTYFAGQNGAGGDYLQEITGESAPPAKGLTPEKIAALDAHFASGDKPHDPPISATEDVVKSAFAGLVQHGPTAVAMTLPNLVNTIVAGPQLLGHGIHDTVMGQPTTKNPKLWQPFYSSEEALQMLPEAMQPYESKTRGGETAKGISAFLGGTLATQGMQTGISKVTGGMKKLMQDTSTSRASMLGLPRGTLTPAPAVPNANDLKALSQNKYKFADAHGGVLSRKFINRFMDETTQFLPQTRQGKMLAGDSPMTKLVEKMQNLRNGGMTLRAAQEIDEHLGDLVDSQTILGVVNKEGKKILDLQSKFREMIDNAAPGDIIGGRQGFDALKEARQLWAASARMRDIEKIITRAEMSQVPATAIKTGFKNLYTNPKRMRGFDASERELIRKAAENGIFGDLLGIMGSRLMGIITTSTGTGGLTGTIASQAASMAARGTNTKLQVGRAQKVAKKIANRAVPQPKTHPASPRHPPTDPVLASDIALMLEALKP